MVSLCPLHSKVSLLSSRQLYTDATTWTTRRPSLLESTFLPFQLRLLPRPPLPVIGQTAWPGTLPVAETAALEEQVAAGHGANLTRLLEPDEGETKKSNPATWKVNRWFSEAAHGSPIQANMIQLFMSSPCTIGITSLSRRHTVFNMFTQK